MEFDYIIVGGGSAGCVLASRLSACPNNQVLLIEAGKTHHSPLIQIPFLTVLTLPYRLNNWSYTTVPQPGLNQRCGYQPRGKALGGSSAINAMVYIRGQVEDYNEWAKTTSDEWSYEAVLPLFKQFEHNTRLNDSYHGTLGELSVNDLVSPNPASSLFIEAAIACGYPYNHDFNGASQYGVGLYQVTQKQGRRHSSADAFLDPIAMRPNLHVMTQAHVLQLVMSGTQCLGVKIKVRQCIQTIKARKKVILCAGAINTPQILLLSGIGSREELARHHISCVHELPGVGANFHDHPDYVHNYQSKHRDLLGITPSGVWDVFKACWTYRKTSQGLMTSNFAEAGGFLSTVDKVSRPDIQLHFVPGIIDNHCHQLHFKRGMSLHVCALRPKSRGTIRLSSDNPFSAPLIHPNFLAHDDDVNVMLKGYKMSLEIMEQDALAPYHGRALYSAHSDDEIIHLLRTRTDSVYHPVGSCRMGADEMAVVDSHLHVRGIDGLMVADASIMPHVVSGNTNAPSMMIAEQAVRFIESA
jgi:choline dehydrogenase-like flavoprotein